MQEKRYKIDGKAKKFDKHSGRSMNYQVILLLAPFHWGDHVTLAALLFFMKNIHCRVEGEYVDIRGLN